MISLEGNASDTGTHCVVIAGKKLPPANFVGETPGFDLAALNTPAFRYNGNSVSRKISPFYNCILPVQFTGSNIVVGEENRLISLCELPQPIALKLLFPKHYFW